MMPSDLEADSLIISEVLVGQEFGDSPVEELPR